MKLWLDDVRLVPDDSWTHTVTAEQCIELLSTGKVTRISLDHDLGCGRATGYVVACWIEAHAADGTLPRLGMGIHSQNPVGRDRMAAALRKAKQHWDDRETLNRVDKEFDSYVAKRMNRLKRDH